MSKQSDKERKLRRAAERQARGPGALSPVEQACQLAFAEFAREEARERTTEYGFAFYRRRDDTVRAANLVISPSEDAVAIYRAAGALQEVLCDRDENGDVIPNAPERYYGDYHVHPPTARWITQFPSHPDLGARDPAQGENAMTPSSVACDVWPLANPALRPLTVAPMIQLVQSGLYGDLWVITRTPGRRTLTTQAEQTREVDALIERYREAYRAIDNTYGAMPPNPTRDAFLAIAREALPQLARSVADRIVIEFREAPAPLR